MPKKIHFKLFAVILLVGLLLSATSPMIALAQSSEPQGSVRVDPQVLQEIETAGRASYWIDFKAKPDLTAANAMDWSERGWYVYEQLSKTASAAQADVANYLSSADVKFQSFWIKNTILVESSDINVLNGLLNFAEIESIQPRKEYILYEPDTSESVLDNGVNAIESNISHVNTDDVWAMGYTGEGLVVASIDTGVRYSHDALVEQYRGNNGDGSFTHDYNWFNPDDLTDNVPRDGYGHGTHTMGTMVGDDGGANQIGMTPGAEWIACAGCPDGSCTDSALLGCAEWIAAPTDLAGENADPDLRPNVVNNSWGDCGTAYDGWYQSVVDAWHAVGTYPVFSNGNASNCGYSEPPGLNTVGNPARYGNVSGVGASGTDNGLYATFSNWGPTDNLDTVNPTDGFDMMKPQFIAPGTSIRSSTPGSDTEYQDGWSGTSMAAPHVTGLVALIWQAAPCLVGDYATTENLIEETAVDIVYDDGSGDTPTNFPNFATGWGEIDALAAVEAAAGLCGDSTLQGTVTDSVALEPLPGAKVEISGTDPDNDRIVYTNETGDYAAAVYGDTYEITVSKFGYTSMTETDVVVESGATVSKDFALEELETAMVSGTVYDGGIEGGVSHGYPLYASMTFAAPGFSETIYTDPFTGEYEIELYLGQEYTVSVAGVPEGYTTLVETFTPDTDPDTQDYTLYIDESTCSAPGYELTGNLIKEGFETGVLPAGWINYDYAGTGEVWEFNDPGGRGNLTPGGEGGFAILDSDNYGSGSNQDAGLQTPIMDFSSETSVVLEFDTDYNNIYDDSATVNISTDGGANWSPIWTKTEDFNGHVSIDLSADAAGYSEVVVEFRYVGSWDWWWEVDDVFLGVGNCSTSPGGVVAGFVYDENSLEPLVGADVVSPDVATQTIQNLSDPANEGLYWVFQPTTTDPEAIEFTASMTNYSSDVRTVSVDQDAVTQQDFSLGTGHLLFNPTSFEVTMGMADAPQDETLTISNDGTGEASFELFERDGGYQPLLGYQAVGNRETNASKEGVQLQAAEAGRGKAKETSPKAVINADVELILDDGSVDNDIGIGGTSEFIFLNRFTPDPGAFPFTLNEIQVYFDDTVSVGDEIVLTVYENTSGSSDPAVGSNLLASIPTTVQEITAWNNYALTEGVMMSGPGDVLIGVVAMETPGVAYYPAAIDTTASQQRSWAGWWLSSPPPSDLALPPDDTWLLIDDAGFPGNWMIRGMGSAGGGDVIWLSEDPVSGVVDSDDSIDVTVTFDPSTLEQPGDYMAELLVQHNTPYVYENIDVTLHLLRPDTWGTLKGTIYSLEACDVNPTPVEGAAINIYDDLGTPVVSLTSGGDGGYSWSIIAGTYDIEVLLDGYETILVEDVDLAAEADVVTDIELRLLASCLTVDPESMEQWLGPDQTATQVLSLINTGAGDGDYEILESEAITTETLLSEGFEGGVMPPTGGWETMHNGDTIYEWTLVDAATLPDFVYDGDYAAWANYDSSAQSDEWLISPVLDVSDKTGLSVSFWVYANDNWPTATLAFWVTDETGAPLTAEPIWDMLRDESWPYPSEYRQVALDLSAYDEYGNLRLAWQYVGLDGDSVGLDLIEMSGTVSLFSMLKSPIEGKVPSYSYDPVKDLPGYDTSKFVQTPGTAAEYIPMDTMIDESFEDAFPPVGWTQEINNAYTWEQADYDPHSGAYYAHVVYDPALDPQDEWLLTPEMNLSEGTLSVWSLGSIYWCRDTYDNCDGNIYLVVGDVGGGDDIFVKNLDEDWADNWLWAESTIDLASYLPGTPFRIGFQYIGVDGAEIAIDDVVVDGVAGEAFDIPWLSEDPIIGTVPADSTLDVDVTFDSTGLAFGDFYALLKVKNTPAPTINVPVALHVIPAPEAFDQSVTTEEDVPIEITLEAVDPESDPLTYMIVDEPTHGTLEYEEGELPVLTYVPEEDYYGMDSFTFKATDSVVDSNVASVSIEVTSVNYQPQAVDDYYRVDENTELLVPAPGVLENDSDDDPLDILIADLLEEPEHGMVLLNEDGSFSYMPDVDFLGEDSFTYNLLGLPPEIMGEYVDSATVYITVNTKPVADDQSLTTDEDTPLDITLTADYITPGPEVWTIVTQPENGSLSGTVPDLVYTPDLDWYGTDSFTFSVNDGQYDSNIATITIEVLPINDPPQAVDDHYETDINVELVVEAPGVLENDTDPDPIDRFNADVKTEPVHGDLVLNADGSFTYMPDTNFFGVDSFEYYMLSTPTRAELYDTATVYITVHPLMKIYLPILLR